MLRLMMFLLTAALLGACGAANAGSLLFSNVEQAGVGRVEISVDNPENLADIGAGDFTLEFWMRSAAGNSRPEVGCNTNGYNWIEGNIIFDRDRLAPSARDFGLAIAGGRIVFGVENSNGSYTICSSATVVNGLWRHVAVQRRASDGRLWVHIDGVLDGERVGPAGDISYPNGQGDARDRLLVIGREKFDLGPRGYRGWIDEVRLSHVLRYQSSNFTLPTQPYNLDVDTSALYHLDETSGNTVAEDRALSPGVRRYSAGAGPEWSTETPFSGAPSPGQLHFSTDAYSVSEGGASLTVTVTRTGGSSGAASVDVSVAGGSATANADYQFTPTTLMWAGGVGGAKTFNLTILDDSDVEGDETINLALSNATGASAGAPSTATVTIADDDGPPPSGAGQLQFSPTAYAVGEGTATVAITVTRTGGSSGAASVDVSVAGGSATSNADYQFTPTTLMWASGQSGARVFNIAILDDASVEGDETINLALSNATGASVGAQGSATVTIADNDSQPAPTPPPAPPDNSSGGGGGSLGLFTLVGGLALLRRRWLQYVVSGRSVCRRSALH